MAEIDQNDPKFNPRWNRGVSHSGLHTGMVFSSRSDRNGTELITMIYGANKKLARAQALAQAHAQITQSPKPIPILSERGYGLALAALLVCEGPPSLVKIYIYIYICKKNLYK